MWAGYSRFKYLFTATSQKLSKIMTENTTISGKSGLSSGLCKKQPCYKSWDTGISTEPGVLGSSLNMFTWNLSLFN